MAVDQHQFRNVTRSVVAEEPDGSGVRLVGSRCQECGAVAFPARSSCSRCSSEHTAEHLLARRGTLWGFTIQGFPPKTPYLGSDQTVEPFEPFGVGYVNLGDEVLVESRLVATSPDELHTGMTMKLVLASFARDHQTYAFAPAAEIQEDQS